MDVTQTFNVLSPSQIPCPGEGLYFFATNTTMTYCDRSTVQQSRDLCW